MQETWTYQKDERGTRYTSSRGEEEEVAQMCPYRKAVDGRTHIVGEREIYKEKRDVLEETRKIDKCGIEKFDTVHSNEKTVAMVGDRSVSYTHLTLPTKA